MARLAIRETFGKGKLINKEGDCELGGNYNIIGLYFSAHWCPPCQAFTPKLANYYQYYNSNYKNQLEIVFVSSDQDERAFKEYFNTMPWIALKFEDKRTKDMLEEKYSISGIPTLVILDKAGNVVIEDGRDRVTKDPTGKEAWS